MKNKIKIVSPNPNLVLPRPPIKNKAWMGKEPAPRMSMMERRLNKIDNLDSQKLIRTSIRSAIALGALGVGLAAFESLTD